MITRILVLGGRFASFRGMRAVGKSTFDAKILDSKAACRKMNGILAENNGNNENY
jgi:hypothetical protein